MEILIVDNSKIYTQILESNLDPESNSIHYFKNPYDAMDSFQKLNYDYICVSYHLEQMDGIEFTRQIRQIKNYIHVPVILFASKKEDAIFQEALSSGITDIFYKEDDIQELVAHIVRFSQRKRKVNANVLFVEDSLSQQQAVKYMLESIGLTVTAFTNASDAFESFINNDYDLVITDILLEGHVSGVKLVNMIRRLDTDKGDVPILAVTAFDNLSRRVDLFCRGVSDYVHKPLIEEEFLSRVTNLINNQRLLKLLREQRRAVEEASEDELSIMACALESSDAILIADAYGHIIRCNQSFTDISGYEHDEVIGKNIWSYSFIDDAGGLNEANIQQIRQQIFDSNLAWEGKGKNKRKNGDIYDIDIKISITRNYEQEVRHYVVVFSDVSVDKEKEALLLQREYYDELTGLANRKYLMKELESEFIRSLSENFYGALLFINLVRFKSINESLGHDIGDKVLIEVAHRLKQKIAEQGIVARIGGQKFAILLPELSTNRDDLAVSAEQLAIQVNNSVCQKYDIEEHSIQLNIHIGISLFPSDQNSIHDIFKQAELANYSASLDKTTIFFFNKSLQDSVDKTAYIEQNLQHALENDEFTLQIQPQYDKSSCIVGGEILIRWEHNGKNIPPDLFIPAAERSMQIETIGQWVLTRSVQVLEDWRANNLISPLFKLAINVSPVQFLHDEFIPFIESLIKQYPDAMQMLQMEVTESIFIEKIELVITKMKQLRAFGIQVAIDDFGTGYSSLSYLTRLPISFLKIDKSFVRDIYFDNNNEMIVETIISMAHHMGMQVVAEGVETRRQFVFLRNKSCEYFQGYLFSRPLDLSTFEQLMSELPRPVNASNA